MNYVWLAIDIKNGDDVVVHAFSEEEVFRSWVERQPFLEQERWSVKHAVAVDDPADVVPPGTPQPFAIQYWWGPNKTEPTVLARLATYDGWIYDPKRYVDGIVPAQGIVGEHNRHRELNVYGETILEVLVTAVDKDEALAAAAPLVEPRLKRVIRGRLLDVAADASRRVDEMDTDDVARAYARAAGTS